MDEHPDVPWPRLARMIAAELGRENIADMRRFSCGLSHYVVLLQAPGEKDWVIRIAHPARRRELVAGVEWHRRLVKLGLPLPKIFRIGEVENYSFAVYQRLPGEDLETVYPSLEPTAKEGLAISIAQVQQRVSDLDREYFPDASAWPKTIDSILTRSEREIEAVGIGDRRHVDLARELSAKRQGYLNEVEPVPFLYDLNVRNALVDNGKLSGIIDVDEVWLGDPLLAVGRGKALLLAMRRAVDYIDYWCDYLDLNPEARRAVDFYALIYCVPFMATIGQKLNGNYSIQTDPDNIGVLEEIARSLIKSLR